MTATQFVDIYPDAPVAPTGPNAGGGPNLNEDWPGLPPGANPESFDKTLTVAGTTILWAPATDRRVVVVSAFISTDTAGRVAIVDDQDIEGRRIAVGFFGANGGASPNLVPAPYPTSSPGTPVRVVTNIAGNVFIRISGYTI